MRVCIHRTLLFNYLDLSLCNFLSSCGLCISGSPIRMSRIFFTPRVQPDNPFVRLNRDPDTRFVAVTTEIRKIILSLWYCRADRRNYSTKWNILLKNIEILLTYYVYCRLYACQKLLINKLLSKILAIPTQW